MRDEWILAANMILVVIAIGMAVAGIMDLIVSHSGYMQLESAGMIPDCVQMTIRGLFCLYVAVSAAAGSSLLLNWGAKKRSAENE